MEGRQTAWRIYRESLPILVVSLAGGIFAGSVLGSEGMTAGFERFPGMLLLLPAFLATRGTSTARWGRASRAVSTRA